LIVKTTGKPSVQIDLTVDKHTGCFLDVNRNFFSWPNWLSADQTKSTVTGRPMLLGKRDLS